MRLREYRQARHAAHDFTGQRVEICERFDFVVEQFDSHCVTLGLGREYIDDVATHPIISLSEL